MGRRPSACSWRSRQSSRQRRWDLQRLAACLLLLTASAQHGDAQFLPGEADTSRLSAAQSLSRAGCTASYSCSNFFFSRTPFGVSGVRYDTPTGRLCYQVTARASCPKCTSYSCRRTTGVASVFQMAPDSGVKGSLASASIRPQGGSAARVSPPKCVAKVGIATEVAVAGAAAGKGVLVPKGTAPASLCVQYPRGTAFRRIGRVVGTSAKLPAKQVCCTAAAAYKPLSASLEVWVRGAGPVLGGGAGCQACSRVKTAVNTGTVAGHVWQDSDQNDRYTPGIDEGFEGIAVNLWRESGGSSRTFLGCTQTDGTGAYKFSRVVADTYVVQFVTPDAGPNAEMRFAAKSTASGASNVFPGTGQTSAFRLASGTATRNALIQIVPTSTSRRRS